MTQTGLVIACVDSRTARVSVARQTACGQACQNCGLCTTAPLLEVEADNPIGARVGDRVVLHADTRPVLLGAALVYLLPLILFFLGWAVWASVFPASPALGGLLGFGIGFVPAFLFSRCLKRQPVTHVISSFDATPDPAR